MCHPKVLLEQQKATVNLQEPSIYDAGKGVEKNEESRIGSRLFPTGKTSAYDSKTNPILSPASGISNGYMGYLTRTQRPTQSFIFAFFNQDLWMDCVCLTFPEQVNDFFSGTRPLR